jgi:uncharacterized phage protein gp47/JayE
MIYENDTDIFGFYDKPIPGHSICVVVEGGVNEVIAREIYLRKTPGCGTYGDVTVDIDSGDILGMQVITPINFFRPLYYDIYITITVKQLAGYSAVTTENIKNNIAAYLNSLNIGDDLTISALWGAALSAMPNFHRNNFTITGVTAGTEIGVQTPYDMEIPFNAVTRGAFENVEVIYA